MGIETGVDLRSLAALALWAEEIVGHSLPGRVKQAIESRDALSA